MGESSGEINGLGVGYHDLLEGRGSLIGHFDSLILSFHRTTLFLATPDFCTCGSGSISSSSPPLF